MALSQMMTHYFKIKDEHKDCIIFYRLGDFYEMFFDDAIKVSSLLDLTLTGRDCGLSERAPMCGVPYHAADAYVARLVALGEKVAICEQTSDPSAKEKSSDLVERDVVRIISAGTLTEDSVLDEKKNNYICSVCKSGDTVSIAWTDITTGEFSATEFTGADAFRQCADYLVKLNVAEIVCNEEAAKAGKELKEVQHNLLPAFCDRPEWQFNEKHAEKTLCEQFSTASLAAFGVGSCPGCVSAAGALVEYLRETQKHALRNISSLRFVRNEKYMVLDPVAIRNLELVKSNGDNKRYGSLLWLLDKTATGMGARKLSRMLLSPLVSKEEIEYRLDGVEELYNGSVVRMSIASLLKGVRDVERLSGKISNGNLTPRDCLALCSSLQAVPALKFQLSGFSSAAMRDIDEGLCDMRDIVDLLSRAIRPPVLDENGKAAKEGKDADYIREGYDKALDEAIALRDNSRKLIAQMESREREKTGIAKIRITYNRVFGYSLEVPNAFKDKVPEEYVRRQTLVGAERYVTAELKELEGKIFGAAEAAQKRQAELYARIKAVLSDNIERFKKVAEAMATLDCLVSFASLSKERRYCRPKIVERGGELVVKDGRHPVVEVVSREKFVPNDAELDAGENRTMILTGPNMAGKSTYMRQIALIVLMAHIGCFVPAASATIPITDRIFTRVGASDNLIFDQSTFMVEMTEVASILLHATKDSLLILDEVGRGTSTYDGLSIAWAVVEFLTEKVGAKTLFATHYHELTELEGKMDGVKNYKVTVRELGGSIVFLRKIRRGGANKSFGVEVAALAGVPKEVTARAKQILKTLEQNDVNRPTESVLSDEEEQAPERAYSEVEEILKETDTDSLTPMQALILVSELKEKLKKEEA